MMALRSFLGLVLWFAGLAETILFWMMRQWTYFIGLFCIGLVLFTKWVAFNLSKQITGMHLSMLGYVPHHQGSALLSFGLAAALLFALAAGAYSRRHWRVLTATGAVMLLIALFAVLQVAFLHSILLKQLLDEQTQAKGAAQFEGRYLPTNGGSEPSDVIGIKGLATQTVWDRFLDACYFMGFGWYVAIVGGLCIFLFGACRIPSTRDRARILTATALAATVLVFVCSEKPLLAHLALVRGQEAESKGCTDKAIWEYREAIKLDGWYAINIDVYRRIGAIDFDLGRTNTLECGIYQAELMLSENNYLAAIAEYERLVETATERSEFLKRRTFEIWTNYGVQLYQAGAVGAALTAWQSLLAQDPVPWLAAFCLSTAYFDTGRYQESIDLIQSLLKGLADPQLRANLISNMGDAYTRLGNFQQAHLAYRHSYFIDNMLNWRALESLVGS